MTQFRNPLLDSSIESQDTTPYKDRPVRQAPEQQTRIAGARSVSLRWPDGMQHAVFFYR